MSDRLPLDGIRVLDLTRLLPGGFCSQMLVDFGAEVIKVEDTGAGDYIRYAPPLHEVTDPEAGADEGATRSGLYLSLNRGKRSIRLEESLARQRRQASRAQPEAPPNQRSGGANSRDQVGPKQVDKPIMRFRCCSRPGCRRRRFGNRRAPRCARSGASPRSQRWPMLTRRRLDGSGRSVGRARSRCIERRSRRCCRRIHG